MGADQSPGLHKGPPKEVSGAQAPEAVEIKPVLFSPETARKLAEDGATLFVPPSISIREMEEEGLRVFRPTEAAWGQSDRYPGYSQNLAAIAPSAAIQARSRSIQAAVYLDSRIFIPSPGQDKPLTLEERMEQETRALREQLGIDDVSVVIPGAPEVVAFLRKHGTELIQGQGEVLGADGDFSVLTSTRGNRDDGGYDPSPIEVKFMAPSKYDTGEQVDIRRVDKNPNYGRYMRWVVPVDSATEYALPAETTARTMPESPVGSSSLRHRIGKLVGRK